MVLDHTARASEIVAEVLFAPMNGPPGPVVPMSWDLSPSVAEANRSRCEVLSGGVSSQLSGCE